MSQRPRTRTPARSPRSARSGSSSAEPEARPGRARRGARGAAAAPAARRRCPRRPSWRSTRRRRSRRRCRRVTSSPGTIGVEQLLAVLVWIVWLAWLQFTVCVLVELRSAVSRGRHARRACPLAGPSQRLARTLVVAVLLLTTAAGQASARSARSRPSNTPASVERSASLGARGRGRQRPRSETAQSRQQAQGETTYWLGDVAARRRRGARSSSASGSSVVQPPEGRYHDNLWDIAERHLGEGRRYHEIFELNKGRDQPDGQELTLARLIYPNWLLVMPEDAAGVERVTAVVTPVEAPVARGRRSRGAVAAGGRPRRHRRQRRRTRPSPRAVDRQRHRDDAGLVGAGLLAAGLLVAVDRAPSPATDAASRRPDAVEMEVALRVGADPRRALLLDHGAAPARRRPARRRRPTCPACVRASIDDDALELFRRAARPAAPRRRGRAPDGGRQWRLAPPRLTPRAAGGAAPYPGLVSLGRDAEEADVLVDLEAAQGPIAIVGRPGRRARGRQRDRRRARPRTAGRTRLRVTGVDLPDGARRAAGGERYRAARRRRTRCPSARGAPADVLGAERPGRSRAGARRRAGRPSTSCWAPSAAAAGTSREVVEPRRPAASPLGRGRRRRPARARAGASRSTPTARVTSRLLGLSVHRQPALGARRSPRSGSCSRRRPSRSAVDERRAASRSRVTSSARDLPPTNRAVGSADLGPPPVRVLVLGEPRVEADGPIDDEPARAVHRARRASWRCTPRACTRRCSAPRCGRGRHGRGRARPRSTRTAAWLGKDAHGAPHLGHTVDGNLVLGPARSSSDWDVVRSLLAALADRGDARRPERDLLREAPRRSCAAPMLEARARGPLLVARARARLERDVARPAGRRRAPARRPVPRRRRPGRRPDGRVASGLRVRADRRAAVARPAARRLCARVGPTRVRAVADDLARDAARRRRARDLGRDGSRCSRSSRPSSSAPTRATA